MIRTIFRWGLVTIILFPAISLAAGIQVSPSKLEINIFQGSSMTAEIIVANPTTDVQLFQIYADSIPYKLFFNPSSFTLEAGARKTVIVTAVGTVASRDSSITSTTISVLSKPLTSDTQFQANAGIKIPLTLTVIPVSKSSVHTPWYGILFILASIFLVVIALFIRRRRYLPNAKA